MTCNPGKRNVLILGHADGDGYLAAEQSRRNVVQGGASDCQIIVHPRVTGGYRFWERHLAELELGNADLVIFVDIMFHRKNPDDSFARLCEKARMHPHVEFAVIDHHPQFIPEDRSQAPANLSIQPVATAYECCFGEPSDELMVPAALCEKEEEIIKDKISDRDRVRAIGVARAAADRGGLAGEKLIQILASADWALLEAIGQEDANEHRFVRGVRPKNDPPSRALAEARAYFPAFDPGEVRAAE